MDKSKLGAKATAHPALLKQQLTLSPAVTAPWPLHFFAAAWTIAGHWSQPEDDRFRDSCAPDRLGLDEINLLLFHPFGGRKYEYLGLPDKHEARTTQDPTTFQSLADIYRKHGVTCHVGSDTPF